MDNLQLKIENMQLQIETLEELKNNATLSLEDLQTVVANKQQEELLTHKLMVDSLADDSVEMPIPLLTGVLLAAVIVSFIIGCFSGMCMHRKRVTRKVGKETNKMIQTEMVTRQAPSLDLGTMDDLEMESIPMPVHNEHLKLLPDQEISEIEIVFHDHVRTTDAGDLKINEIKALRSQQVQIEPGFNSEGMPSCKTRTRSSSVPRNTN